MRFLLTDELGRLTRWLRLMGYDAAQQAAEPLTVLYRRAYDEERVVVTRRRSIGASCLFRVVQLRSETLEEQLAQLVRELQLTPEAGQRFTRCDRCNVELEPVDKSAVREQVPPYVYQTQARFRRCAACGRVYWTATHCQRADALLDRVTERPCD
jgi:uncharacterized protein with PIN domain